MKPDAKVSGPGTVIGTNVVLTGILKDAGDITIHGSVEGEVHSDRTILIGETAQISGPVTGQVVTIAGKVKGSVEAEQKLEILSSGKIFGSISTRELVVRPGAIFVGKSTMPYEEEADATETEDEEMSSRDAKSSIYEHSSVQAEQE